MRSLIFSLLFVAFSVVSYGQAFESCTDSQMPGNVSNLVIPPSAPTTLMIDATWTANADGYMATNLAAGFATAYWSFNVASTGYYSINIEGAIGSPSIANDVSMSLGENCAILISDAEIFTGLLPANAAPETAICTQFTSGVTYTVAIAIDPAFAGDIIITVIEDPVGGASNEDCAGAISLPVGMSLGDNSCSDGLVWYSYTVVNGGTVSVSVSPAGNSTSIIAPAITQTNSIGCGNPDEGTTTWPCLPPGTVVYFEAGDGTAPIEQGDFNIDITDDITGVLNELCSDVADAPQALTSCTPLNLATVDNTTVGACPELVNYGGCGIFNTEATVWYAFTTDADIQTLDITINSTGIGQPHFVLIEDDGSNGCNSAPVIGCNTTGASVGQIATANTTYYIGVASGNGVDGTFDLTVIGQNPPVNDACASAIDVSGTAAFGVDGTTSCATLEANDFCTAASEDHVVYYTYTVDAAITGNRDVTFTFTTNTNTSGTAATGLFFGLFEDCVGTTYVNTPDLVDDPCDALIGTVTYECVEPGTVLTIAVGSEDLTEGDFNIMIVEDDTNVAVNDACENPTVLASGPSCTDIAGAGDNTNGCPEVSDLGSSCIFSSDLVVWYELTLPAGATGIDFSDLSVGAQLALFENDCPTLTLVENCFTIDTEFTSLIDGGTYLLAVSQTFINEGVVTFTWSPQAIPTNDDCSLATNPDIILETAGTTGCADFDFASCLITDAAADHQVFYTYTNTSGSTVDLEITIEGDAINGNAATQVSITALDNDCTAFTGFYPGPLTDSEWCDILGAGMQTLPCIENGETVILLFSSAEGAEGDFTILASGGGMAPIGMNDECDTPVDVTPANCVWEVVAVDNNNACPEDFAAIGLCDFDVDPVVWYSFTVPVAPGIYQLDIQNITDAASYLTIFDVAADCDLIGAAALSADCETGAGPHGSNYDDLTPGDTYLIAFGNPTPGIYSFEIKLSLIPDNDECADAIALIGGTLTDGTTSCASQPMVGEYNSGVCTPADQTNTVFYTYEVPATDKGFNVTVTGAPVGGLMGDINLVIFEDDPVGACATGAGAAIEDEVCTTSATVNEFECVGSGTYVIRVSTSALNEGDFQITITPIALVQPNDNCDAPDMSLNPGLDCTWQLATANTVGACPEDTFLDPSACGLSVGAVVWYEITAPFNATFLDIRLTSGNGANPMIAVFPGNPVDCDMQSFVPGSACYDATFTDLIASGNTLIPVTGGTTYLIAVGVTDPSGSMIDFGIKWITPPDNDECADAIALVGATPLDGTTACATQPLTGEYNSNQCTDADETNTVFYTYEVPDTDKGFNITITGSITNPLMGDINLVVFEDDPTGACATGIGAVSIDDVCTSPGTVNEEFECIGAGTYVIRVSTSSDNEGGFSITITPLALEQPNDNCDAPDVVAFTPALECEWMVIGAETVGACPEDMNLDGPGCGLDDFPVTWYEVTAPANAEFLDLQINFGGANPFIAVFETGVDCDNLTYVAGSTCYGGTFDELNDLGQAQIDITPSTTYLIAIGTDAMAGGTINFGIKWITPPDNDECVDAEDFDNLMPSGNPGEFSQTLVMETTQCATGAITGTSCDDDNTNTVWYTYTVEPDVKEITIDITNWMNTVVGGTPDLSLAVLDGCVPGGAIIAQADGSAADYCGGEGTELITLSCLDEGDVITILVSSSSENEGTFDITLNTAEPDCVYTNDECPDAVDIGVVIMDDPIDCIFLPGCNDLACTEFDFSTVCPGIDVLNSVFYTFTTDDLLDVTGMPVDAAFVNLEIISGQAGELDNPGAILLSGDCNSPAVIGACAGTGGGGEFNSGPLGMPGQIMPNTTYTVVVYNSNDMQNGGTFDLCITVTSGCVNDDICDAFTLEPGVTIDNPASSNNCTDDFVLTTGCDNKLS